VVVLDEERGVAAPEARDSTLVAHLRVPEFGLRDGVEPVGLLLGGMHLSIGEEQVELRPAPDS